MAPEFRKTGISVVGNIPWGTHFCHFYETKQDLLDTLVPYFKAGLESKEFCVWVVSNSGLITVEEAKGALAQALPDLHRHLSNQDIEILNGLDWYLEENVFNLERVTKAWDAKLKRALARGYEGMRVSGDTFWLAKKDWKDFFAYEKQLNESITDRPMTVLCTYPLAKSGAGEVLDVVQAHRFAIARRRGKWDVVATPELVQAKAEIKRLNETLQRASERTPKPSVILSYGVAALSVSAALIIGLWMESVLQSAAHVSLFLCAVMLSAWFGGVRPGLLAIALSLLAFAYVLPPNYSLAVETREIPRLLIFALSALLVGSLSAALRSKAESLRHARDILNETVQELKRSNVALQAENAERKRAEDALRRSEDHLRLVIDTIPTMAWSVRPDGLVDFLNQRWLDYTNLSLEQYVADPMGPIHPEDVRRVQEKWRASMVAGEPYEAEMRLRRADGEHRWFLVRTAPLRDKQGTVVNWYGVSIDIEDRKQAGEQLKATSEQLRALSAGLQSARDLESTRIAREIHDELGAALSSLRWDLEEIVEVMSEATDLSQFAELQKRIEAMMELTDTTVNIVRRIASELRPIALDELGLSEAIEWQARQFQERTGIIVQCDCTLENVDLSREQATAAFRICQEALTNILRHALATRVNIQLKEQDGSFILTISDNGRGITDAEKSGRRTLGLIGMRERAHLIGGKVGITGSEGKGTVVTVLIPTSDREEHADLLSE